MTAPIPGGATRSGTPARIQASATSGVERPPNSVSIPACPSSPPVTLPDATRTRRKHLQRRRTAPFPAPRAEIAVTLIVRGSADALGQRDDDPFRSADVGHPPGALVLA